MRRLQVVLVDVNRGSVRKDLFHRAVGAVFASIMPQAIAGWCEEAGHDVTLAYFENPEQLLREVPDRPDIVFFCAYTSSAQLVYALSSLFRARGAVTALGGPHARSYPEDARRYHDYVLGFTDAELIRAVLSDCSPHRPEGLILSAEGQTTELPGVRRRWPYLVQQLRREPLAKLVPMLGSVGCPYTCSFCIDATNPYQPLDPQELREDLRFLRTKLKRPAVLWHDPNFGVRFDEVMTAIEEAVPPDSVDFIAESSLALLSEARVQRLARNGFKAILPGIESWYEVGNKSRTGPRQGTEKVDRVAEHVNTILPHLLFVQANFILGLDSDAGEEPFELTRRFIERAPGAYPQFSLLTAYGRNAALNLDYQRAGRLVPVPFHFLNGIGLMNVRPANYSWPEFFERTIGLLRFAFSQQTATRRFLAKREPFPRTVTLIRTVTERQRIMHFREIRRRLLEDLPFRQFFEGETTEVPAFLRDIVRRDLGPLWEWLPAGALEHDPNAYLHAHQAPAEQTGLPELGPAKGARDGSRQALQP